MRDLNLGLRIISIITFLTTLTYVALLALLRTSKEEDLIIRILKKKVL